MSIHDVVKEAARLYSLPDICLQLQELISKQASVFEIADQVALDPALTARLLKIANSPFYNFPMQVDSVSRAVRLIGTNELYNLALATSAVSTFNRLPRDVLDMESFWELSVHTGLVAKFLGKHCGFRQGERLFTAGLLFNIGLLALLEQKPDACRTILSDSRGHFRADIEQSLLGYSFADVGHALLSAWRLPTSITLAIKHQHLPETAGAERVAASIIHVARYAAQHLLAGHAPEKPSEFLAAINPGWKDMLGSTDEQLQDAMRQTRDSALQVLSIIAPSAAVVV